MSRHDMLASELAALDRRYHYTPRERAGFGLLLAVAFGVGLGIAALVEAVFA